MRELIRTGIDKSISTLVNAYLEENEVASEFVPGKSSVPVSGKVVGTRERELMVSASLEAWLTTGKFNRKFERELGKFCSQKHALTVNSGSSANLVAFSSLTSPKLKDKAFRPGDEVISVAAGFPTTINPIIQNGGVPVFLDVDVDTLNFQVDDLERALSAKTRAVFIAHTLGNPYDLSALRDFCDRYELWLIEDCCDALGAEFNGRPVGTFGDMATLSFYPAHHITMGEGGAVMTDNDTLASIAESFRDWGRDCYCPPGIDNTCGKRFEWALGDLPHGYDHKYIYSHLGYNLKITDMQAACGLAQLEQINFFVQKRRANFQYLYSRMEAIGLPEFFVFPKVHPQANPSWFGFPLSVRSTAPFERKELIQFLTDRKIGTRLLFAGNVTKQPYMQGRDYRIATDLAGTDFVMNAAFWVGVFPGLDKPQLDYVIESIYEFTRYAALR